MSLRGGRRWCYQSLGPVDGCRSHGGADNGSWNYEGRAFWGDLKSDSERGRQSLKYFFSLFISEWGLKFRQKTVGKELRD